MVCNPSSRLAETCPLINGAQSFVNARQKRPAVLSRKCIFNRKYTSGLSRGQQTMPDLAEEKREMSEQERTQEKGDVEVEQLMGVLIRGSAYKKLQAARDLGKIGVPAVPRLIEGLNDEDPQVRWRAAIALGAMGGPAVDPLISVLESSPSAARIPAAWAAAEIGDARAVDPLVGVMTADPSECCRVMAAAALLKLGDEKGVDSVREECTKKGEDFTGQVLEAYWGT
jgi:HEAT repeat protein